MGLRNWYRKIRNGIRRRVASRIIGRHDIDERAQGAVDTIQDAFVGSMDRHRNAWGQYIDPPSYRDHVGIYGTSSAVTTLLLDGESYLQRISGGQQWLIDEWNDNGSDTARRGHRRVLYKFVFITRALAHVPEAGSDTTQSSQIELAFQSYCRRLWERKVDWGWGEFWYDDETHAQPKIDTTALALYVLAQNGSIRDSDDYQSTLKSLADKTERRVKNTPSKVINQPNALVNVALTLCALGEFDDKSEINADWIDTKMQLLASIIDDLTDPEEVDEQAYDFRLYSTPPSDDFDKDYMMNDRYILHIVYPIVGLSLVTAGEKYVAQQYRLVRSIITKYSSAIEESDKDAFISNRTNKAAHIDQMWIASFLGKFADDVSWSRTPLKSLLPRLILPTLIGDLLVLVVVAVLVLCGFYVDSLEPPQPLWVRAFGWLLFLSAGVVIKSAYKDKISALVRRVRRLAK